MRCYLVFGLRDFKHTVDSYQAGNQVTFQTYRYYFPEGWQLGTLDGRLGD